jgi:hypothetical protein
MSIYPEVNKSDINLKKNFQPWSFLPSPVHYLIFFVILQNKP